MKTPKIIDYRKDETFQCLLSDAKVVLNYLEQYNGKKFESSDYICLIKLTKMQCVKDYLEAMKKHIETMENEGIMFI